MKIRLPVVLLLVALSASATAQKREAAIWRDPGAAASLNLFYGAGGQEHAPRPNATFTFEREDLAETSPKFDVEDDQRVQWRVKLGEEPQSETSATRLLWAAGYFVDEDYYVAELKIDKLPTLQRGQEFVSHGAVHNARLERRTKERKKLGTWDWFDNPFLGTRELNGLRVMMSLLNDWDLSTLNNSIYEVNGERQYAVSDAGATFGNTGNNFTRSKSVPKDYAASKFVEKAAPDFVDFALHSRPFFLGAINVDNYRDRTRMEQVTKHIPRADAVWLGQRLSMLSEEQIRDAFRAAGYTAAEIEILTQAVRKRIAELAAL